MATANKFAVLADLSDKRKHIVVSDTIKVKPKKEAAPEAKKEAPKTAAAKKPAGKVAASTNPNAPATLKEVSAALKKERELKAKADATAAEAAAAKAAAAKADAAKVAADEASKKVAETEAATAAPADGEAKPADAKAAPAPAPEKPTKTMEDFLKEREANRVVMAAKQTRGIDKSQFKGLKEAKPHEEVMVIKAATPTPKPAAKAAKKPAAKVAAPAPVKKEEAKKEQVLSLAEFAGNAGGARPRRHFDAAAETNQAPPSATAFPQLPSQ